MSDGRSRNRKVDAPALPAWYVERPRLRILRDEALTRRLTTVVAGAGFGKSALLAEWATDVPSAWYTLDRRDESAVTLARGLAGSIGPVSTELSESFSGFVGAVGASPSDERRHAEALAAAMCDAIEGVDAADLLVVLDDAHEVGKDTPGAALIESFCRQAPAGVHVALSSREAPVFPIERLRGRGEVLSVDASHLVFSTDELRELLVADLDPSAGQLAGELERTTAGWPAAVRLAVETLRDLDPSQRLAKVRSLGTPGGLVFSYLAEEVFAHESDEVRELLRHVAPLRRFTRELCERLGVAHAARTIDSLVRRGLFVSSQDDWHTLHDLVRDFVTQSWPLDSSAVQHLHACAAEWYAAHDRFAEALESIAAAGNDAELAKMLSAVGGALIVAGQGEDVIRFAELLPEELRDESIERLIVSVEGLNGNSVRALDRVRRMLPAGPLAPSIAVPAIIAHLQAGEPDGAEAVFGRTAFDGADPRNEAGGLVWMAVARNYRGNAAGLAELAARARSALEASDDARVHTFAHTVLSTASMYGPDMHVVETHARQALDGAARRGSSFSVLWTRTIEAQFVHVRQGRYAEALEILDEVVHLSELRLPAIFAFALAQRGLVHVAAGDLEQARQDLEIVTSMPASQGWTLPFALLGLADVQLEHGHVAQARSGYEQTLQVAEKMDNRDILVPALSRLARVVARDEPELARSLADRALSFGYPAAHARALVAAGWVSLAQDDRDRASHRAAEGAETGRRRDDRPALAEALELQALCDPEPKRQPLEEALELWRTIGNPIRVARVELALGRISSGHAARVACERAERRLVKLGVGSGAELIAGPMMELRRHRHEPLSIRTLGDFGVIRDGRRVEPKEWQSKKARDLLKVLVAHRGRRVPREVLMEALWPGEPREALGHRLSVALATLRKVLDPDARFPTDHFLLAGKDALAIQLANVPVDVESFLVEAQSGLDLHAQGRSEDADLLLVNAAERYAGDFLEETYEDWAVRLREEARAAVIAVSRALAGIARAAGDRDRASRYLMRVLQRDPYDEEAHLSLVSLLAGSGRHGEARRSYGAYAARMSEIGVESAPFPARTSH